MNTILPETRTPLLGLSLYELEMQIEQLQLPRFRARLLWRWVWRHGLTDFSDMTDLGKSVQSLLAQHFHADRPLVSRRQDSADGTIKWLIKLVDGQEAETVYIPDSDRGTLCISSQVGCTLNCSFCHTGTQRLVRNLSVDEICGQVLLAMDELGDWPAGKFWVSVPHAAEQHGEPINANRKVIFIADGFDELGDLILLLLGDLL